MLGYAENGVGEPMTLSRIHNHAEMGKTAYKVHSAYPGRMKIMAEMIAHFKDFMPNLEAQTNEIIIFIFNFRPGVLALSSMRGLHAPI